MNTLYDCFLYELQTLHDAERQLVDALSRVADRVEHEELKEALTSHQLKTEDQVQRIDEIFEILDTEPTSQECTAMLGLIAEMDQRIEERLGDAALICAAQKIEHYEIAAYGTLRSWAKLLDYDEAANLLEEGLDEETNADEHLTSLALQIVNLDARETEHSSASVDSAKLRG